MPSPVYQYVISLVVSLPIRGGPSLYMKVSVLEHHIIDNQIFYVAKFTTVTPLSLLSLRRLSFPIIDFKYSLSQLLH